MAKQLGKLTAIGISRIKQKGVYSDGGNLYLQVSPSGIKSWIFRYNSPTDVIEVSDARGTKKNKAKAKTMGLGPLHTVTLAKARDKATDYRRLLNQGIDPLAAKASDRRKLRIAAAKEQTFKQCAEAYIASHKAGWKNAKHLWQWENTLERFAYPLIGNLPVQLVDIHLVLKILEPIWQSKTETATRLRGRIESIVDWATVRGLREGDNPARWRGRLDNLLPSPGRLQKVKHHPALPYDKISAFMTTLREQNSLAAFALELTILTATRTNETLMASWEEFDDKNGIWTIPASRMKLGREHRIPLSKSAILLIEKLKTISTEQFVFPGRRGKALSNMSMLMLLRRMGFDNITVHGFRSSFRDWCAEQTNYPREVAEAALAHAIGNDVEAAYRRGDLLEKRKQLMNAWAIYCATPAAKVKAGSKIVSLNRSR